MMQIDVNERAERAMGIFKEGYNCCQSVALAFEDVIKERTGMDHAQIMAVTSGFGGGFGRMREVCGCVSGMTFMAGVISPAPAEPHEARMANYKLVQELADAFRESNGSIVCRDLLGIRTGQKESPMPSERTEHYYKARPCAQLVANAAEIVAKKLLEL